MYNKHQLRGRVVFDIESGGYDVSTILRLYHAETDLLSMDKEKAEKHVKKLQKLADKPALDPLTGYVLAIGYAVDDNSPKFLLGPEKEILTSFWSLWVDWASDGREICGFNICGFDIPYLAKRSAALGIRVPVSYIWTKPDRRWPLPFVLDVMLVFNSGAYPPRLTSLDDLSRFLGVGTKNGQNGAAFADLLHNDNTRDAALEHLANDVTLTRACAERVLGPAN